jgi:hypothetical protein
LCTPPADAVVSTAVETIGHTVRLQYLALTLAGSNEIAAAHGSTKTPGDFHARLSRE